MKIRLYGIIEAEGEAEDMALFCAMFFNSMKQVQQAQEKAEMDTDTAELLKMIDDSLKKGGDGKA